VQASEHHLASGIIYCEAWNAVVEAWEVVPMLAWLQIIDVTLNPNMPQDPVLIPLVEFTNQLFAVPQITGYRFWWNHTYLLDSNIIGLQFWYITHARRLPHHVYLNPLPGAPQQMAVNMLMWGVQINQFRGAWS
jgi:hypothetical protein